METRELLECYLREENSVGNGGGLLSPLFKMIIVQSIDEGEEAP